MDAVWDPRLITRERALELAGTWPIYMDAAPPYPWSYVRCRECGGSCGKLEASTTLEAMLSGVLRHLVMVHDVSLSGRNNGREGNGRDRPAASADAGLAGTTGSRS